jgi:hypothetical protein
MVGVAAEAAADLVSGSRAAIAIRQVDRVGAAEAQRQLDGPPPDRGQRAEGEPLGKMRFRQPPGYRATHNDGLRRAQLALDLLTKSERVIERTP